MKTKYIRIFLLILLLWPKDAASAEANGSSLSTETELSLFQEALTKLQNSRLEPVPLLPVIQQAIRCMLRQVDSFSDYLLPGEYAAYKSSLDSRFGGVGMDISTDLSGQIICIPYPKGPAARAGVRYGDTLRAVNGHNITPGESLFLVGAKIRGQAGTRVLLTLQAASNPPRKVTIVLEEVQFRSVIYEEVAPLQVIRILRFTAETADELKKVLSNKLTGRARIIDLRGNIGGDLFSAIDAAALFLKSGARIVDLKTRQGNQTFVAHRDPVDQTSPLFLWQDGQTASAAEVFIAALTQNRRAVSMGKTSYGKGVTQRFIDLTDGSALLITYGALIPPGGASFHQKGLTPTYALPGDAAVADDQQAYVAKVKELLRLQKP
jgi:carboxyl-terminal processing protease